jgi:hypothetical protein
VGSLWTRRAKPSPVCIALLREPGPPHLPSHGAL